MATTLGILQTSTMYSLYIIVLQYHFLYKIPFGKFLLQKRGCTQDGRCQTSNCINCFRKTALMWTSTTLSFLQLKPDTARALEEALLGHGLPRKILSKTLVATVCDLSTCMQQHLFLSIVSKIWLQHWTLVFCTSIHSFFQGFLKSLSEQYPVARSSTG